VLLAAEKLVRKGRLAPAIREYMKLVAANSDDYWVSLKIGDLYIKAEMIPQAVEVFSRLAAAYRAADLRVKAIAVYKRIAQLEDTAEVQVTLGDLFEEQRLNGDALKHLALAAKKTSEPADRAEILSKMIRLAPDSLKLRVHLAAAHLANDQPRLALTEYRRASVQIERADAEVDPRIVEHVRAYLALSEERARASEPAHIVSVPPPIPAPVALSAPRQLPKQPNAAEQPPKRPAPRQAVVPQLARLPTPPQHGPTTARPQRPTVPIRRQRKKPHPEAEAEPSPAPLARLALVKRPVTKPTAVLPVRPPAATVVSETESPSLEIDRRWIGGADYQPPTRVGERWFEVEADSLTLIEGSCPEAWGSSAVVEGDAAPPALLAEGPEEAEPLEPRIADLLKLGPQPALPPEPALGRCSTGEIELTDPVHKVSRDELELPEPDKPEDAKRDLKLHRARFQVICGGQS
jgi:hypothetical protein